MRDRQAEELGNTVSVRLADGDAETLSETLRNVEAKGLFYTLADAVT